VGEGRKNPTFLNFSYIYVIGCDSHAKGLTAARFQQPGSECRVVDLYGMSGYNKDKKIWQEKILPGGT
jgi:hypothetical protein